MPVTRSAAARAKVQQSEDHDSSSNSNKHDEKKSPSNGDMANGELPKTVKDFDVSSGEEDTHLRTSTALLLLILIFLTSFIALAAVYLSFPNLEP